MNDTPLDDAALRDAMNRVRVEVGRAVVGQDGAVTGLLIALLAQGHVLLEGVPGVAKTLLVRAFSRALGLDTKRIQFTPDLMPGDVSGSLVYDARTGEFDDGIESSMPLPYPFKKWEKAEAQFYRGAVSVLAGPPGSGKTISALNIVNQLRVPTLYFSNDSTRYTIIKRAFSMLSGYDARKAAEIIEKNPDQAYEPLNQLWMVRWDFSSSPDMEEIAMYGDAFREVYGEYPHLTVIDIAMNVDHEGIPEQNYWRFFPAVKEVASSQNTAALVVHHTSENAKFDNCPPKSSVMGKANQLQELIITQVMRDGQMWYSVVKNRNGDSDETGNKFFTLPVDASKCKIEDEDPDEGLLFRDGPSVPEGMKINNNEKGEW